MDCHSYVLLIASLLFHNDIFFPTYVIDVALKFTLINK